MSATLELSDEDLAEAIKLLLEKKEDAKRKTEWQKGITAGIKIVFDKLNVPYSDCIRLTRFRDERTIIHADSVELYIYKGDGEILASDDNAGSMVGYHDHQLSYRSKDHGAPPNKRDIFNHCNHRLKGKGQIYGINYNTHNFFVNRIEECPLCSEMTGGERRYDWSLDGDFSTIPFMWLPRGQSSEVLDGVSVYSPDKFYSTGLIYKRCRKHKATSRRDYLSHEYNYPSFYHKENLRLFREVYPEPIKGSKKHFAERRIKKVARKRPLTKSEVTFFSMLLGAQKLSALTK